ncbi:MAG: DEAD/DEAH box helicase [Clostridiales bacterium]|nr:DEAD/DEAH box helicase [Clostridiales bacterium]
MERYINKGSALAAASDPSAYKAGEKYFKDGRVKNLVKLSGKGELIEVLAADVQDGDAMHEVKLGFNQDGAFVSYSCTCGASAIWRGACKHVIAALFAVMESHNSRIEENRAAQATQRVTKSFEKLLKDDVGETAPIRQASGKKAILAPFLFTDGRGVATMSFKVGFERLYAVKKILDFTDNVRGRKNVVYGKNLAFTHDIDAFDERSRELIGVLTAFFDFREEIRDTFNSYYYLGNSIKDRLPVTKKFLDEFFEVYKDEKVSVTVEGEPDGPIEALFTDDPLDAWFFVEFGDKSSATLKSVAKTPTVLRGAEFEYFLSHSRLHRIRQIDAKPLLLILDGFKAARREELIFSGKSYESFLNYVLPRLKESELLTKDSVTPENALPRRLEAKLYMDVAKGGKVTCEPVFVYDNEKINPITVAESQITRDLYAEARVLNVIARLGFSKNNKKGVFELSEEETIYDLYLNGLDELRKVSEVFATNEFSGREIKKTQKAKIGARLEGGLLTVEIENTPYSVKELLEAMDAYKTRKRYFKLKSGKFINLEDDNIRQCENLLSSLDVSKKDVEGKKGSESLVLPSYRAFYADAAFVESDFEIDRDEFFNKLIDDVARGANANAEPPESLRNILRDYQTIGFKWLKTLSNYGLGGILADDMGLGKTLQVIALLLDARESHKPSIVVTPTSLIYNWEREIRKFAPQIKAVVIAGLPTTRKKTLQDAKSADVFITTYDTLKRDISNYGRVKLRYIIADEAQYVKNPATRNAEALKRLKGDARFALTGTPVENALSELWSIFDFIIPGYLQIAPKFSKQYEIPIMKNGDEEAAKRLKKIINPFILRRLKSDVLSELPEKVETTLSAELTPEQLKIYASYMLSARDKIMEAGQNKIEIIAIITRLRQICCHPSLFLDDYNGGSGKLDLTLETVLSAVDSGHRMLIFSQFTSMLALISEELKKNGVSFHYIDGATKAKERVDMVERFNDGQKSVFLISLKAGGSGLNLIGADMVLHYDQWWNPAVMSQATDRAHRIGQKNVVQVFHAIAKDTIEEKILALQERKRELVDSVIENGVNFLSGMNVDELRDLFTD